MPSFSTTTSTAAPQPPVASPAAVPTPTTATSLVLTPLFSPTTWYRLTTLSLGPGISLDLLNDAGANSSGTLEMASTESWTGQYWQIIPAASSVAAPSTNSSPSSPGYHFRTLFLGPAMRLSIPPTTNMTPAGTAPTPRLARIAAGPAASQIWHFEAWGDGSWRITCEGAGEGVALDVMRDKRGRDGWGPVTHGLFMRGAEGERLGEGGREGGHWVVEAIEGLDEIEVDD